MDLILIHVEAETLVRAAIQFEQKQFYSEAEKALLRARELYTILLEADFDANVAGLVGLLIVLGKVYTHERKFSQAATILAEAAAFPKPETAAMIGVVKGLARLYTIMGDVEAAVLHWERLLQLESVDPTDKALAYQHLGEIAGEGGHQESAIAYFDRAVEVAADREVLLAYGASLSRMGDWGRAKELFLQAKDEFDHDSDENRPLLLFNLINVHYELGEKVEARQVWNVLKLLERRFRDMLAAEIAPLHGALYARILGWMGALHVREKETEVAKKLYLQQVELYQQLELINPGTYLGRLSAALQDLGTVYRNDGQFKDAENTYSEAITIRSRLAAEYPAIYEPLLARNLMSLARLYMRMDARWQAGITMQGAIPLFERMMANQPEIYEKELVSCYKLLGQVLYDQLKRDDARDLWLKWIPIQERLAEKDPANEESDLYQVYRNMARYHLHYDRFGDAEPYFERLLEVKEKYRVSNPLTYDGDMASTYAYKARTAVLRSDLMEAEDFFEKAIRYYQAAIRLSSERYRAEYVQMLKDWAKIYDNNAGTEPSIDFLRRQLRVYEMLDALVPGRYSAAILEILMSLCSACGDADDFETGIVARKKAGDLLEKFSHHGSSGYKPLAADNLFWLAILYMQHGDVPAADETYRACLGMYEQVVKETDEEFNEKYANVLMYYGKFLQRQGYNEAAAYLAKAEALAQKYSTGEFAIAFSKRQ